MASYATVAELKTYINELTGGVQTSFSVAEDALLQVFLNEATAEIDRQTGRKFTAASAVKRYYFSESVTGDTLYLDADLNTLVSLKNGDGTTISEDDLWLLPINSEVFHAIKLKSTVAWTFGTDGTIEVEGDWGFSGSAPDDIKRVCKRLAWFYWMKRTASGETSVVGDSVAVVPAEYPEDVMSVLRRYRRGVIR